MDRDALKAAYISADGHMRDKWHRSLSFGDTIDDRWERAERLGFGSGSSIYNSATVFGDVRVGENTWIGPGVLLEGSGGDISIGSSCSISAGVHIYTHNSLAWALSGGSAHYSGAAVEIADRCYIGPQSIIGAGVRIGSQCVVAANTFLNCDMPARTVWGGTPARRLGTVEIGETEIVLRYDTGKETCLKI